jgi:hypothetical protein
MKALEKDRRRYETAGAFAADIARYRKHLPIEAGPPSAWYRGRKFVRRHRLGLTVSSMIALSLAVAGGMWGYAAIRLDRANRAVAASRSEIRRRAAEARQFRYATDMRQAFELLQNSRGPDAIALLERWRPRPGDLDVRNFA